MKVTYEVLRFKLQCDASTQSLEKIQTVVLQERAELFQKVDALITDLFVFQCSIIAKEFGALSLVRDLLECITNDFVTLVALSSLGYQEKLLSRVTINSSRIYDHVFVNLLLLKSNKSKSLFSKMLDETAFAQKVYHLLGFSQLVFDKKGKHFHDDLSNNNMISPRIVLEAWILGDQALSEVVEPKYKQWVLLKSKQSIAKEKVLTVGSSLNITLLRFLKNKEISLALEWKAQLMSRERSFKILILNIFMKNGNFEKAWKLCNLDSSMIDAYFDFAIEYSAGPENILPCVYETLERSTNVQVKYQMLYVLIDIKQYALCFQECKNLEALDVIHWLFQICSMQDASQELLKDISDYIQVHSTLFTF